MPRVRRRYYTDPRTGERKAYRKYYARVTFAGGSKRWVPLSANKAAAETMLRRILEKVELEKVGLGDPFERHRRRPLTDHLADWEAALRSGDAGEKHVRNTVRAARRVFDGCGCVFFADVSASAVQRFLAGLKTDEPPAPLDSAKDWYSKRELAARLGVKPTAVPPLVKRHRLLAVGNGKARRYPKATAEALETDRGAGMGTKTVNMHLAAVKQFCRWMVLDKRAEDHPLAHLSGGNPELDRRTEYATLTAGEIAAVIAAARTSGVTFRGLAGADRAMLYTVATYTAFRPVELSRLTPNDFVLDGPVPLVRLDGSRTKNGKAAEQPIPAAVADLLGPFLENRPAAALVWPGTWFGKAADMIRVDLPAAGVPDTKPGPDGRPLVVTFYSLRHSAGPLAEQGGATAREVMTLMRHSDPKLTFKTYGKLRLDDRKATVEKMPAMLPGRLGQNLGQAGDNKGGKSRTGEETLARTGGEVVPAELPELLGIEENREVLRMTEESSPGRIRTFDPPVNSRLLYR